MTALPLFTVETHVDTVFWSSFIINDRVIVSPSSHGFCFLDKHDISYLLNTKEVAELLDCFIQEVHCEHFHDDHYRYIVPVYVRFQKGTQQLEFRKRKPGHSAKFRWRLLETSVPCTSHSKHLKPDEDMLYDKQTGQAIMRFKGHRKFNTKVHPVDSVNPKDDL